MDDHRIPLQCKKNRMTEGQKTSPPPPKIRQKNMRSNNTRRKKLNSCLIVSLAGPCPVQLGTKHMAPPGGATSKRPDSLGSYCVHGNSGMKRIGTQKGYEHGSMQ